MCITSVNIVAYESITFEEYASSHLEQMMKTSGRNQRQGQDDFTFCRCFYSSQATHFLNFIMSKNLFIFCMLAEYNSYF